VWVEVVLTHLGFAHKLHALFGNQCCIHNPVANNVHALSLSEGKEIPYLGKKILSVITIQYDTTTNTTHIVSICKEAYSRVTLVDTTCVMVVVCVIVATTDAEAPAEATGGHEGFYNQWLVADHAN
jgi:hypothetical protein